MDIYTCLYLCEYILRFHPFIRLVNVIISTFSTFVAKDFYSHLSGIPKGHYLENESVFKNLLHTHIYVYIHTYV